MQKVWPNTIVEEVNLAHNISVFRKALGQNSEQNRFIITVPGKGCGFVAEVAQIRRTPPASAVTSEYQVTRSRLMLEEDLDDQELSAASANHSNKAGESQRVHRSFTFTRRWRVAPSQNRQPPARATEPHNRCSRIGGKRDQVDYALAADEASLVGLANLASKWARMTERSRNGFRTSACSMAGLIYSVDCNSLF